MLVGSASAKWGILAPIFVPMLILVGFHPAFTQAIYRVGDSITNPITPMMPYLPLLLSYAQSMIKYETRYTTIKFDALLYRPHYCMDSLYINMVPTWYTSRPRRTPKGVKKSA